MLDEFDIDLRLGELRGPPRQSAFDKPHAVQAGPEIPTEEDTLAGTCPETCGATCATCDTCEGGTCEGTCVGDTCQGTCETCFGTCAGETCLGTCATCEGTCATCRGDTCDFTCAGVTCEGTCEGATCQFTCGDATCDTCHGDTCPCFVPG
jgi:hypothetical protein